MIWYWFMVATRRFVGLFILPHPSSLKRLRANAKCPACGATSGHLRCVHVPVGEKKEMAVRVQHTCDICGARSYEAPMTDVSTETVYPAIARNENEKYEDFTRSGFKEQ